LVPNEKYWGTKPTLQKVIIRIITKDSELIPAMRNKEINAFSPIPTPDLVAQAKQIEDAHWFLGKNLSWEHFDFNLKNPFLADKALRLAMFTAIDRKAIIDKTVGQYAPDTKPFGNHNFVPAMKAYKDHITPTGQGSGDIEKAKKILTDAGYKIEGGKLIGKNGQPVPTLRFRYTTGNQLRQQSGELLQAQLKNIGVDVKIEPLTSLGNTLSTGDYDIIIFAWVGTPFIADSKSIFETDGGQNYGKYSNPQVDKLLADGAKELDPAKLRDSFNQADEIMSKDAYVLPLYQKPVFIAVYSDYVYIRNNPTAEGQTYNIDEWALKA
jgi:peptide/nickel transport system substrate-binding protein